LTMKDKKILVVAAHADDEILGCGGTVARMVQKGCEAFTLILGEGITSRDEQSDTNKREHEIKVLKKQVREANRIIGIKEVFIYDFPDNRFDSVNLLDIVKVIETIKEKLKPDIIFTHFSNDLNIDHRITYNSVITATRPMAGETVKEIYSFEVLSSTEWSFPLSFLPDTFFDISSTLELKTRAMAIYNSELRDFPHPRSVKGIELNSAYWGMRLGCQNVEAFKCIRRVV